jgi:hypothetical protein
MLIKELTWNGPLIWPPQWTKEFPEEIEHGLLKKVDILPLTDLIKIEATCSGTILSGLIFSREEYQGSLYLKLKENIGKPLKR